MLVLSRKIDERIVIGECIVVTVLAVNGQQIRLGFEAPREVPIVREELSWSEQAKTPPRNRPRIPRKVPSAQTVGDRPFSSLG